MREVNEKSQLVPTHTHLRNSAEQAICNFKEYLIVGLDSPHKDLPLHLWCQILPHASLKLSLLQKSRTNPKLSGYAKIHKEFNYNDTPLSPTGT